METNSQLPEDVILEKIGEDYDKQIREYLVIELALRSIQQITTKNMIEYDNRNQFKSSLYGLNSMLADYHDEEYTTEVDKLTSDDIGNSQEEIEKCFKWFSLLKKLISRTPLQKKGINVYQTLEEVPDDWSPTPTNTPTSD